MRIQRATPGRDDECDRCAYPLDPIDEGYRVNGDDTRLFCSVNCATRTTADESLADHVRLTLEG